jgi:hypothetical protein
METLKMEIPIPNGYDFDSFDKLSRTIKLKSKPKNVMERIKTVADLLDDHGLTQKDFDKWCEGLSEDEIAFRILKMVNKSLNEEWEADWNNSSEYKYYPWFDMRGGSSGFRFDDYGYWITNSGVGSRLCFKSRELAEHAGKHFTEIYKQFMVIE